MKAQVSIRDKGYVVEAYFILYNDSHGVFKPIRNFGDMQSRAIEFRNDIQNGKYDESTLLSWAKQYDKGVIF